MKRFLIGFFVLSVVSLSYASEDDTGSTYYGNYQGKKYESVMLKSTLNHSPNLDLTKPELPISLSKIIDIAYSQLVKVTGTREGWKVSTISLNNWYENRSKWFYAVSFDKEENFASMANITVTVTVDGKLGVIKEVSEKIIN